MNRWFKRTCIEPCVLARDIEPCVLARDVEPWVLAGDIEPWALARDRVSETEIRLRVK